MIFRYILGTIRMILLIVIMIVFLLVYLGTSLIYKRTQKRDFRLRRNYLKVINPILGVKITKTGDPISDTAIYVSNHRSFIDPFVVAPFVDVFFVAKAEVGNLPILSIGFDVTGVILVDRDSQTSRSNTREKMVEKLSAGYNVLIYPEGTTGAFAQTKPFKMGTFSEAAKNGFTIVPVSLEYKTKEDRWASGGIGQQYFRQIGKWKTHVKLHFGNPLKHEDRRQLSKSVKESMNQNMSSLQKNWSEPFIPYSEPQTS